MDTQLELKNFIDNVHQEIILASEEEGSESLRSQAFTRYMLDEIQEAGDTMEGQACFYKVRGAEVCGYGIEEEKGNLDLFISIYNQVSPPASVNAGAVETAFKRLAGFLKMALVGLYKDIEEASPEFDMALAIFEARTKIKTARFFLLTDGLAKLGYKSEQEFKSLTVSYEIWDILRLYRYVYSGRQPEPIHIDFQQEFGTLVPCLAAQSNTPDYSSFLAILPGTILNGIYSRYGARLLELNVRSFLQARGKVNQGIRNTILKEPEKFLAYNNGISATAHTVELVDLPQGGKGIKSVKGLQIVNGGQTTASIYYAVKSNKADVSQVFVQVKLTVVDEITLKDTVPLISRYANSQNKVNEADFSANDPFHVEMETLSRNTWAPATDGIQRQTRWFYERARGQYTDAINREGTPTKMQQFKLSHPNSQRFTKTDLAKFENTWDQYPHIVSLGAQKSFVEFTMRLKNEQPDLIPDQLFYRRLIAKAILFKEADKIITGEKYGGYKANIVTYTLAWLSLTTSSRIDLDKIWREQNISPVLAEAIKIVSKKVYSSIINPPGNANITEWCKKEACWDKIQDLIITIPSEISKELVDLKKSTGSTEIKIKSNSGGKGPNIIQEVSNIPPFTWASLSEWGKETGNLPAFKRSLATHLATIAALNDTPSVKQAREGLQLLEEAELLGFKRFQDVS